MAEGWLYMADLMDLYSCRIVDWPMGNRITRQLTINALEMAIANRQGFKA
jgi:putative transposase